MSSGQTADLLDASWSRAWTGLGAVGEGGELKRRLIAAWSELPRHYHTLQHLTECLSLFGQHAALAGHPAEVEVALWFHDAIYDVKGTDNEAKSAEWAARELAAAHVSRDAIARVESLIMATCHAALPEGQDQQLLVDIDLSILGAPRPRFEEYESQVRQEYGWVPGWMFRRKRRQILEEFLARPSIYNTAQFRDALEAQARANLAFSIRRLS